MAGGKTAPAFVPIGTASRSAQPPAMAVASRWRGLAYFGVVLCSYFLFLVITLPAYWADRLSNRASLGAVRIQEPEGTLWNGSGNLVIRSAGQERMQTRIAWELQTLWLFAGKLQARFGARNGGPALNATIRAGYHHLSIQDVDATLPLSILSAFIPAMDLVAPSGRLQITAKQAILTPAGLDGDIQLTWLDAGTRMGGLSEAGDYRLVINGRGATAGLSIETLRGDIGITGQGEWQAQNEGLLRLTGNITPGSREQALRPLLTMMNARNNNGQYSWAFNGRFPLARILWATP